MPDVTGGQATTMPPAAERASTAPVDPVRQLTARLAEPGLFVLTGAPGSGRSTALHAIADSFPGTVFTGGGLAILRTVPGLALSRAVRARLPVDDQALTAEAVRSRVRGGLLVIDDAQWADPLTLAALPALATHCRVLVALRTPHRLPGAALRALRDAATDWVALPPLSPDQATALAHRTAPGLGPAGVAEIVARAGGVPLAVEALARHAMAHPGQPTA
ncbi:MAG: ATP-binding protein, partial [Actinocatenispora sp.]